VAADAISTKYESIGSIANGHKQRAASR
jgi:hypothetical protein